MTIETQVLREALADLFDAFISRHGCFPLDRTTPSEVLWNDAMRQAHRLVGKAGSKERSRALTPSVVEVPPPTKTQINASLSAALNSPATGTVLPPVVPTAAMLNEPLVQGSIDAPARYESRRDLRPHIYAAMVRAAPTVRAVDVRSVRVWEEGGDVLTVLAATAAQLPVSPLLGVLIRAVAEVRSLRDALGGSDSVGMRRAVAEAGEGGGTWQTCSGCCEPVDGDLSRSSYAFSDMFECFVGSGCSECGGLGVVWEGGCPAPGYDRDGAAQILEKFVADGTELDGPRDLDVLLDALAEAFRPGSGQVPR